MNKIIDKFRGNYAFLSNFEPCKVSFNGRVYRTVEHAFQAAKSLDVVEQKLFQFVGDPGEAKKWGKQVKLRDDWETVKESIMKDLLMQKFTQEKFKKLLLETCDATIIEGNNHRDTYWGVYKGTGKNRLGELIMEVREEIKEKENNI